MLSARYTNGKMKQARSSSIAQSLLLLLALAVWRSCGKPVATYGETFIRHLPSDPNFISLAISDSGYLYAGIPYFTIMQFDCPKDRQDFTAKRLITLKLRGTHVNLLELMTATDAADDSDILVAIAQYAITDLPWGPVVPQVYLIENPKRQEPQSATETDSASPPALPVVELCTLPEIEGSRHLKGIDAALDGKAKRLFYIDTMSSKLCIANLVLMRDQKTGQPGACPLTEINLPNAHSCRLVYDAIRNLLFVSIRPEHIQVFHAATGASWGILVLPELTHSLESMKLDTAFSILYCHVRRRGENSDAIYAYDVSNLEAVRLANIYPFPLPFYVDQMEIDNKMGILHTIAHGDELLGSTPWHWAAISSERHAMVMNITISDAKIKRFVLRESEIGFYGHQTIYQKMPYFARFVFEYSNLSAVAEPDENVNLGVVF